MVDLRTCRARHPSRLFAKKKKKKKKKKRKNTFPHLSLFVFVVVKRTTVACRIFPLLFCNLEVVAAVLVIVVAARVCI